MEENYESIDGANEGIMAGLGIFLFVYAAVVLLIIISNWKIYSKAGKPGWAAIVPIYNIIVLLEIVGKPVWWIILLIVPFVNIVIAIMLIHQLSVAFGKGVGTTLLLLFLPFIGYPMLAFGDAQYTKPIGATAAAV
jgi:hypothetical protein